MGIGELKQTRRHAIADTETKRRVAEENVRIAANGVSRGIQCRIGGNQRYLLK